MTKVRETVDTLLVLAISSVEEAIQWLPEDLTVGDGGVAEAIVHAENTLNLALLRLRKQEEK